MEWNVVLGSGRLEELRCIILYTVRSNFSFAVLHKDIVGTTSTESSTDIRSTEYRQKR
jgi:hypothetical protein